jgi:hypothetical protein
MSRGPSLERAILDLLRLNEYLSAPLLAAPRSEVKAAGRVGFGVAAALAAHPVRLMRARSALFGLPSRETCADQTCAVGHHSFRGSFTALRHCTAHTVSRISC